MFKLPLIEYLNIKRILCPARDAAIFIYIQHKQKLFIELMLDFVTHLKCHLNQLAKYVAKIISTLTILVAAAVVAVPLVTLTHDSLVRPNAVISR
jgi:hypothetical protein